MDEIGWWFGGDKDRTARPAGAGGEVGRSSPLRRLVLMVNLPPEDAGRFDLLKLLEESLSLDSLRWRVLTRFGDNAGLALASVLTVGEGAEGAEGIFFFCRAPFGELAGGLA